jgi:hypothetical protein
LTFTWAHGVNILCSDECLEEKRQGLGRREVGGGARQYFLEVFRELLFEEVIFDYSRIQINLDPRKTAQVLQTR